MDLPELRRKDAEDTPMNYRQLPSGLFVPTEPEKPKEPEPQGDPCVSCGKRSVDEARHIMGFRTRDRFDVTKPCCKHGSYLLCPECDKTYKGGCPVCGCHEEYT